MLLTLEYPTFYQFFHQLYCFGPIWRCFPHNHYSVQTICDPSFKISKYLCLQLISRLKKKNDVKLWLRRTNISMVYIEKMSTQQKTGKENTVFLSELCVSHYRANTFVRGLYLQFQLDYPTFYAHNPICDMCCYF